MHWAKWTHKSIKLLKNEQYFSTNPIIRIIIQFRYDKHIKLWIQVDIRQVVSSKGKYMDVLDPNDGNISPHAARITSHSHLKPAHNLSSQELSWSSNSYSSKKYTYIQTITLKPRWRSSSDTKDACPYNPYAKQRPKYPLLPLFRLLVSSIPLLSFLTYRFQVKVLLQALHYALLHQSRSSKEHNSNLLQH